MLGYFGQAVREVFTNHSQEMFTVEAEPGRKALLCSTLHRVSLLSLHSLSRQQNIFFIYLYLTMIFETIY